MDTERLRRTVIVLKTLTVQNCMLKGINQAKHTATIKKPTSQPASQPAGWHDFLSNQNKTLSHLT